MSLNKAPIFILLRFSGKSIHGPVRPEPRGNLWPHERAARLRAHWLLHQTLRRERQHGRAQREVKTPSPRSSLWRGIAGRKRLVSVRTWLVTHPNSFFSFRVSFIEEVENQYDDRSCGLQGRYYLQRLQQLWGMVCYFIHYGSGYLCQLL